MDIKYLITPAILLVLSGCGKEEVHDIDYYLNNDQDREEKMDYCRASIERQKETNCLNAIEATAHIKLKKVQTEGYENL